MLLLFRTASHEMEKLLFIQQDFLDEMQDNQPFWSTANSPKAEDVCSSFGNANLPGSMLARISPESYF